MNKLELAIFEAIDEHGVSGSAAVEVAKLAAETAVDFLSRAAADGYGDFGYAIWLAESDAE